jgi:hypothetical protein
VSARASTPARFFGPAFLRLDLPFGKAQPSAWRWVLATILAVGTSLLACFVLARLAVVWDPALSGYPHFQFRDYALLTIVGVFGACVGWPLVSWFSSRGRRLYLWLAIAVTVVSLAPDAWILHLGQPAAGVATLNGMHFALGVITLPAMVFIAPQRTPGGHSAHV